MPAFFKSGHFWLLAPVISSKQNPPHQRPTQVLARCKGSSGSHGPAGFGAAAAGFGAATAVIMHIGMFFALLSAGVADRCA